MNVPHQGGASEPKPGLRLRRPDRNHTSGPMWLGGLRRASWGADWRNATLDDVRGEFIRLVGQLIAAAATKTDAEIRADHGLPWAPPGTLWEFIGRDTFLYEWPAHRAQLEAAVR